jgi:predicted transposase YbfD/YdcC
MVPLVRPFRTIFDALPDSRQSKGKRHPLAAVLVAVTLALIHQQNTLGQIAAWVQGLDWRSRKRLALRRNQVPSESTIRRVLRDLDVRALTEAVRIWVEEVLAAYLPTADGQGLAIDGKTLRGSRDADEDLPALQVLNAMVHELGAFIQSQAVPVGTNELGIIQAFLEGLVLSGRVVTLDALFTHPDIAHTILDKEGHYLMRVKANQPRLLEDLQTWFYDPSPFNQAENVAYRQTEKGHGRLVQYTLCTTEALNDYLQNELHWPAVGQAFYVERRCINLRTGEVTTKTHYAITSLGFSQTEPATLLNLWRQHWHIENKGHWVLDVVFGEDASKARKVHLPKTLSLLRKAVITLLRLFGQDGITVTRSALSANVEQTMSLIGLPLDFH